MMTLTVTGMFKELKSGHKIPPLRYFFKTVVVVPAGSGLCICNEEVHISNATPQQTKVYYFFDHGNVLLSLLRLQFFK